MKMNKGTKVNNTRRMSGVPRKKCLDTPPAECQHKYAVDNCPAQAVSRVSADCLHKMMQRVAPPKVNTDAPSRLSSSGVASCTAQCIWRNTGLYLLPRTIWGGRGGEGMHAQRIVISCPTHGYETRPANCHQEV